MILFNYNKLLLFIIIPEEGEDLEIRGCRRLQEE